MSSYSRSVHGGGGGGGDTPAQQTTLSIVSKPPTAGSYGFMVEGYSKTRGRIGVDNSITSDVFTLGSHRWQIKYYPDGCSDSSRSVALVLVETDSMKVDVRAMFWLLGLSSGGPVLDYEATEATLTKKGALEVSLLAWERLQDSGCLKDDYFKFSCDIAILNEPSTMGSQFVAVPPSDMHRHYASFLLAGKGVDVMFEVRGETFSGHRCILAARSSVFMAELFGPMKESTTKCVCICIHDMDARVFKAMLDFIYTDELPKIDDGEVMEMTQHLLVAADRYNLQRLKLICEHELCNYINPKTAASMLTLCHQHGCHGLRKACFKFLASVANLQAAMVTQEFKHLKSVCPDILDQLAVANLPP